MICMATRVSKRSCKKFLHRSIKTSVRDSFHARARNAQAPEQKKFSAMAFATSLFVFRTDVATRRAVRYFASMLTVKDLLLQTGVLVALVLGLLNLYSNITTSKRASFVNAVTSERVK